MNTLIYILTGLAAGIIIGLIVKNRQKIVAASCCAGEGIMTEQIKEKEENLQKIRDYIEDRDKITNDDIEKLLKVSNATTARYLDEMEKEGLLKQVGITGKYTYYEKV